MTTRRASEDITKRALALAMIGLLWVMGPPTLDYGVVDARMTTAHMHLRMPSIPVSDDKKADVAIAKKFEARITAARK